MDDARTMLRTEIRIDGRSTFLAQGQDVDALKRRIEAATKANAPVEFVVVGNRRLSVPISSESRVAMMSAVVSYDARDTGDETHPF